MQKKKNNQKGFTLIELLVTVTILAVIIGISLSFFSNTSGKHEADAAKLLEQGRQYAQAMQGYYAKNGSWSNNGTALIPDWLSAVPAGWTNNSTNCNTVGGGSNFPCQIDVNGDGKNDYTIAYNNVNEAVCKILVQKPDYNKMFVLTDGATYNLISNTADCSGNDEILHMMVLAGS